MSITSETILLKMNEIQSKGGQPIGHWCELRLWLLENEQIQEPFYEAVINDLEMTAEDKAYWLSKTTGKECTWSQDNTYDGDGNWNTSCGNMFLVIEDTPSKNDMKFCCYCGARLVENLYQPEPEDEE